MTTTMIICSRCGWQLVSVNGTWQDRMGNETCVHDEPHDVVERSRK